MFVPIAIVTIYILSQISTYNTDLNSLNIALKHLHAYFICYLAASWPLLGYSLEERLTNPTLITMFSI